MDKLTTGLQIMVIGMGVVFMILIVLYGAMALMEKWFQRGRTRQTPSPSKPPARAEDRAPPARSHQAGPPIAVITAAVAAAQGPGRPFRITSIKIAGERSAQWRRAGIRGNMRQSGS